MSVKTLSSSEDYKHNIIIIVHLVLHIMYLHPVYLLLCFKLSNISAIITSYVSVNY